MPSAIGLIFLSAGTLAFLKRPDWLFPLLIFAGIFQGASIVSSESIGIQPYYLVAVLLIGRALLSQKSQTSLFGSMRGGRALATFAGVGIAGAFILPCLFAGTPVYDPRAGIDAGFESKSPLSFSFTNVAQAVYLAINVAVVVAARRVRCDSRLVDKSFLSSFYFLLVIISIQVFCLQVGLPFPNSLLNNNGGYATPDLASGHRANGTFVEPSYCGAVLVMFAAGFLIQYLRHRGSLLRFAACSGALLMVASSSSLVVFGVIVIAAVFAHPILRFPWYVRIDRLRRLSVFLILGFVLAGMLSVPALRDLVLAQTVDKGDSWSYLVRTTADLDAIQIAAATHWIGVGLGGNRPSSLLTSLLSTTGAMGLCLFLAMFVRLLRNAKGIDSWMPWAGAAMLLSMALGIPDVTLPEMWVILAICASRNSTMTSEEYDDRGFESAVLQDRQSLPCTP